MRYYQFGNKTHFEFVKFNLIQLQTLKEIMETHISNIITQF